ncbi:hypothetical protein D9M72_546110 [compost metagenome]
MMPNASSASRSKPAKRICTARGLSKRESVPKSVARRCARGAKRGTPDGPVKKAGVPVSTRYKPGNRPESTSSMSWRSALRALSRTSDRIRCRVSTSSNTTSRPGCPASRRISSRPCRKPKAPKWSRSPRIPAPRLAEAPTWGWPPSQAASPSATAASPVATAAR